MHKIYTLKNGLRIVAENNSYVNSITVGVMIQNGSRNERLEVNGISHFLEHSLFKGTKKRSKKEIFEAIENVGGQINAYTGKETTCFYVKNLYTHLDLSLDILSDIILNSTFEEEEINKEKQVVIEEIKMNEDSPEDVLYDLHSKVAFDGSALAYPIAGTSEKVNSFTSELLKKYVKEKYTPYNSVLSICGKYDEKELEYLIEKYFSSWTSETVYKPSYDHILNTGKGEYIDKPIEQLHISLGLNSLCSNHEKEYTLILLSNILGGGASSILFQKLREEMGLCYSAFCYPMVFRNVGLNTISMAVNRESGLLAIEAVKEILKDFSLKGITNQELTINKEKIKAGYILGRENSSSRMFSNAKSVLFENRVKTEEDIIKEINNINMNDVVDVLDMCFKPGIINAAYLGKDIDYLKFNDVLFQ